MTAKLVELQSSRGTFLAFDGRTNECLGRLWLDQLGPRQAWCVVDTLKGEPARTCYPSRADAIAHLRRAGRRAL